MTGLSREYECFLDDIILDLDKCTGIFNQSWASLPVVDAELVNGIDAFKIYKTEDKTISIRWQVDNMRIIETLLSNVSIDIEGKAFTFVIDYYEKDITDEW